MDKKTPWHEQDEFWETGEPILFSQQHWANAPAEVDRIISLLEARPGSRLLDLCCGVGRHALEFARRGFIVTGVDRTRPYLDRAGKQAELEDLDIEFIREDMRRFVRPSEFDVAANLFTSFGYFENPADDRLVAENIYKSLKPSGVLVMDMMGKEIIARSFQERVWREEEGLFILEERKVRRDWGWVEGRWIMITENERYELHLSNRLYSAEELKTLLRGCGFEHVDVFGNLAGRPYDEGAERLVVRARK
jgi:SAM-dependent methyltransferase